MDIRRTIASLMLLTVIPVTAACSSNATAATETGSATTSTTTSTTTPDSGAAQADAGRGGGPGGGVDVASVSTEEELIALVQEAYGDAGLGLHRGHQPVEDVLDEVLAIDHEDLHSRMDSGQNLAAVAEDVGVDPQTLVDALVEAWSPAIDTLQESGQITEAEAEQYREALREAFTFRVTWNGSDPTPTFSGIDA